jgi:hypothetical protein
MTSCLSSLACLCSSFGSCFHHTDFSGYSCSRRASCTPHPHASGGSLWLRRLRTGGLLRTHHHQFWCVPRRVTLAPPHGCPRSPSSSSLGRGRDTRAWRTFTSVPMSLREEQLRARELAGREVWVLERKEGGVSCVFCRRWRVLVRVRVCKNCRDAAAT